MRRYNVSARKDKLIFSKTAGATKAINTSAFHYRGGIRL